MTSTIVIIVLAALSSLIVNRHLWYECEEWNMLVTWIIAISSEIVMFWTSFVCYGNSVFLTVPMFICVVTVCIVGFATPKFLDWRSRKYYKHY